MTSGTGVQHRDTIAPLSPTAKRPRWSVMIPVYNGAEDLRRSLRSVLDQAPDAAEMQIEVVDDCSTRDDPAAVAVEVGARRVAFFRQPQNVGHTRNFDTCIARARGELVHILHADDWVGPGFYAALGELFDREPSIGAGFCRTATHDEHGTELWLTPLERETAGVLDGWLETLAGGLRLQPPSIVVRRSVYEALGGFDRRMKTCGEDWEMWARIAASHPVGFVPEVLAFYHDSSGSLTKRALATGQNIRDVRQATRIVAGYLPAARAKAITRQAMEVWAEWALYWSWRAFQTARPRVGVVQLREALICSRSPAVLAQAARLAWFGLRHGRSRRATRG